MPGVIGHKPSNHFMMIFIHRRWRHWLPYSSFFQNLYNVFMYNVCTCVSHCTLYSLLTPIPFRAMGVDTLTVLTMIKIQISSFNWWWPRFFTLQFLIESFTNLFHCLLLLALNWHCLECRFAYLQIVLDSRLCWQNSGPALITENVAPRGQIGDSDCTAEPLYPRIRIHQILLILTIDPQKHKRFGTLAFWALRLPSPVWGSLPWRTPWQPYLAWQWQWRAGETLSGDSGAWCRQQPVGEQYGLK